tara:strand:- start:196 stop:360 length:165 start_codon:yes stop_codon:yes gene_type:complete
MATKLWKVEMMGTMGWSLYDETSMKLTKDQAKVVLESAMSDGVNPKDLRAVPDV